MSEPRIAIECQDRDIALLRDLFVSRVMTLAHIAALHFDGRPEAAKKRVQKLKAGGLIAERPRKARDPSILRLTTAGYDLLVKHGHIAEHPRLSMATFDKRARVSDLTIRHELEVMDTKAALAPAIARTPGMALLDFCTWPRLCQFDVRPSGRGVLRVRPDGFIRVEEQEPGGAVDEHVFFLEVDRGTETLDTLTNRAVCYRNHYTGGGFATLCGSDRTDYVNFPFRVLMVFPSDERRNNVAERLLALTPPIQTLVWLAITADVQADPLGAIWVRPRDYREVVTGTIFDARARSRDDAHRRQPERERHVTQHVVRRALFSD